MNRGKKKGGICYAPTLARLGAIKLYLPFISERGIVRIHQLSQR